MLHSLGVEVLDERPYEFVRPDGTRCWLYTFGLRVDEVDRAGDARAVDRALRGAVLLGFQRGLAG